MRDRRTALLWAVAWWFGRRWIRRRAALAVAGAASGAAAHRGRLRGVLAAFLLVGVLAAALVVWRRLAGRGRAEGVELESPPPVPEPFPGAVPA